MADHLNFKNPQRELSVHRQRIYVAFALTLLMALVLIGRLAYLQIVQHELYTTQSDKNRVQLEAVSPTRGLIYDRNGVLLADNQPSFSVRLVPERIKNLDETLALIGTYIPINEDHLKRFHKHRKQRRRPFEAVPLKFNLDETEISSIAVNQHQLPGVEIAADLIRHYPHGHLFAHALGYVGRINEREAEKLDPENYSATHYIGKVGIENYYEESLHGTVGYQKVEKNAHGRIINLLERLDPTPGENLHLTLDVNLQKIATESLGKHNGSVVAIDTLKGDILAFASAPAYNPNLFVTGISQKDYSALRDSRDRPLFNRALRGQYPPASTVKPFIGLAALENKVTSWNYSIKDPGWYQLENDARLYRDWKKWGHGKVNLEKAIIESCDTYFYDIAYKLGIDPLHDFMAQFGFGERVGIDLKGEAKGLLPSSFWKRATRGTLWYPGETLSAGIGQGYMLATPLQLATATAILANKGKKIYPKLFKNSQLEPGKAQQPISLKQQEDWLKMHDAMIKVSHSLHGTALSAASGAKYKIAGKTGTAQVLGIAQEEEYDEEKIAIYHRDHALFVAFAPADNPKIAIAVIVENGGSGGRSAAPIARKIFDAYLIPPENSITLHKVSPQTATVNTL
jgi:penicillin-binding protein 2